MIGLTLAIRNGWSQRCTNLLVQLSAWVLKQHEAELRDALS